MYLNSLKILLDQLGPRKGIFAQLGYSLGAFLVAYPKDFVIHPPRLADPSRMGWAFHLIGSVLVP